MPGQYSPLKTYQPAPILTVPSVRLKRFGMPQQPSGRMKDLLSTKRQLFSGNLAAQGDWIQRPGSLSRITDAGDNSNRARNTCLMKSAISSAKNITRLINSRDSSCHKIRIQYINID
jgi:hypothetical protein